MTNIQINLSQLIFDKRLILSELAHKSGINRTTLYSYLRKQTITMKGLKKIEAVIGDCSQYIKEPVLN